MLSYRYYLLYRNNKAASEEEAQIDLTERLCDQLQPEVNLIKLWPGALKFALPPSHSKVIGVTSSFPKFKSTTSVSLTNV